MLICFMMYTKTIVSRVSKGRFLILHKDITATKSYEFIILIKFELIFDFNFVRSGSF
jgi:hypothetical protein